MLYYQTQNRLLGDLVWSNRQLCEKQHRSVIIRFGYYIHRFSFNVVPSLSLLTPTNYSEIAFVPTHFKYHLKFSLQFPSEKWGINPRLLNSSEISRKPNSLIETKIISLYKTEKFSWTTLLSPPLSGSEQSEIHADPSQDYYQEKDCWQI